MPHRSGWTPWQCWVLAAVLSSALSVVAAAVLPYAAAQMIIRLAVIGVCQLGIVSAGRGARRAPSGDRSWRWLLVGAFALIELAGWWYLLAGIPVSSPARGQLTYSQLSVLAPLVLVLLALLRYPAPPATLHGPLGPRWWIATLLDGLIVVCSVGLLAWTLLLRRVVDTGMGDIEALVVVLLYCAAGVLMACTAVALWIFRRPASATGFVLLATGIVMLCLSFFVYAQVIVIGSGGVRFASLDCWVVAVWLLTLACLAPAGTSRTTPSRRSVARTRWAHAVLPLLPLGVAGLIVLYDITIGAGPQAVDIAALLALPLLGLARQMVILADNIGLLHRLEISERRLHYQAFHDPLTGLANRALFGERLRDVLDAQRHDRRRFAVLYVDLDDFKRVNDTLGHAAGDRLLQVTAQRLSRAVRSTDTVARLGGDEFAILLIPGGEAPATVGSRVLTAVRAPALLAGARQTVRASVGLVVADADEELSAERVLHRADAAMYAAKSTGKGTLTPYTPGLAHDDGRDDATSFRAALIRALRGEPGDGWLWVRYSPIVDLPETRPAGLRAELRWSHPALDEVPAADLVATSEQQIMFPALNRAVFERILADLPRLRDGPPPPPVHLAVSATVPPTPAFVTAVRDALDTDRLRDGELILDIVDAERDVNPAEWAARLAEIGEHRIGVCLADFGMEDASLVLLCYLAVDIVALGPSITGVWTSPTTYDRVRVRGDALRESMRGLFADLGVRLMVTDLADAAAAARAVELGATLAAGPVPTGPIRPTGPAASAGPAESAGTGPADTPFADAARRASAVTDRPGGVRADRPP
ncbi:diguanylate cyclase [Frankia sp. AgB32]|uniref:diguanylate cyclase domain-containing protein n=1 Tax=Frankia sp. AgB32 TaxID=631119 RepID=UPI00200C8DB8|nr:diguanylate cyclase [Frankia sp. AgB32]MCK9895999.1 diguanylate cyclase [Frankia sp. AgB32]